MRKANIWIETYEAVNGPLGGVRFAPQGCPHHCKGCFNPETWDPNGGSEYTSGDKEAILAALRKPGIARLTISGGEPLESCNQSALLDLIATIKSDPVLSTKIEWIVIFTGYVLQPYNFMGDSILTRLLRMCDMIVDGPFKIEEKGNSGELFYRGSRNQRLIDVAQTVDNIDHMEQKENAWIEVFTDDYFRNCLYRRKNK